MKSEKQEPCPFCGRAAEIHKVQANYYRFGSLESIPLTAVDISGPMRRGSHIGLYRYTPCEYVPRCTDTRCPGRGTKRYATREEALERWNERA